MKIKVDDSTIKEFPDRIAALIIADPSYGREIPDLSANEVNALIHGVLASIYKPDLSYEKNVKNIESRYTAIAEPSDEIISFALRLIEKYKNEVTAVPLTFTQAPSEDYLAGAPHPGHL